MAATARPDGLVKMSEISRLSGVPAPTIKHYIREGLLPEPALRTSRNMAYYDPKIVGRIKRIKDLQKTRFLPLKVIKDLLDERMKGEEEGLADAIREVLGRGDQPEETRTALVERGVSEEDINWLINMELIQADPKHTDDQLFRGDDVRLIDILTRSRNAGLTPDMLPASILIAYAEAIRTLVRLELQIFRTGVMSRAGEDTARLTEVAAELSEDLVTVLRRKLIVPTLNSMHREESGD
jgi:DNA-binding transcriptional MerR regulator